MESWLRIAIFAVILISFVRRLLKSRARIPTAIQCPITAGQSSSTHAERISSNNISIHVAAPIRQEK